MASIFRAMDTKPEMVIPQPHVTGLSGNIAKYETIGGGLKKSMKRTGKRSNKSMKKTHALKVKGGKSKKMNRNKTQKRRST